MRFLRQLFTILVGASALTMAGCSDGPAEDSGKFPVIPSPGTPSEIKTENFTILTSAITPRTVEVQVIPKNEDIRYYVGYVKASELKNKNTDAKKAIAGYFKDVLVEDQFAKAAAEEGKTIEAWLSTRLYSEDNIISFPGLLEDVPYYFYAVGLEGDALVSTEFAMIGFLGEDNQVDDSITFDVTISTTSRVLSADITPMKNGVVSNDFLYIGGFGRYDKFTRYSEKEWIDSWVQTVDYYLSTGGTMAGVTFNGVHSVTNSDRDELLGAEPETRFVFVCFALDTEGTVISKPYWDKNVYTKEAPTSAVYFKMETDYITPDAAGEFKYLVAETDRIKATITPYKDAAMTQPDTESTYLVRTALFVAFNSTDPSTGELVITPAKQVGAIYRNNIEGLDYSIRDWTYAELDKLGAKPHKGVFNMDTQSVDAIISSSIEANIMYSIYAFAVAEDGTVLDGAATLPIKMNRKPLLDDDTTKFKFEVVTPNPTGSTIRVSPAECVGKNGFSSKYFLESSVQVSLNHVSEGEVFDVMNSTQEELTKFFYEYVVAIGFYEGESGVVTMSNQGSGYFAPDTEYCYVAFAVSGTGLIASVPHRWNYSTPKSSYVLDESLLDKIDIKLNKFANPSGDETTIGVTVEVAPKSDEIAAVYIDNVYYDVYAKDWMWVNAYKKNKAGYANLIVDHVEYKGYDGDKGVDVTGTPYFLGCYRYDKKKNDKNGDGVIDSQITEGYIASKTSLSQSVIFSVVVKGTNGKYAVKVMPTNDSVEID